jgi:hypothetical protein
MHGTRSTVGSKKNIIFGSFVVPMRRLSNLHGAYRCRKDDFLRIFRSTKGLPVIRESAKNWNSTCLSPRRLFGIEQPRQ